MLGMYTGVHLLEIFCWAWTQVAYLADMVWKEPRHSLGQFFMSSIILCGIYRVLERYVAFENDVHVSLGRKRR